MIQLGQTKSIGPVHENRVHARNVDAAFDDLGTEKNVVFSLQEFHHHAFQLLAVHLSVGDRHSRVRHRSRQHRLHFVYVVNAVVDEVHLSAPVHLVQNGLTDKLQVELCDLGDDGKPVAGRRLDEGEVPRTHERELQRSRDGRCRQCHCVYARTQLAELFLGGNAESVLFVDDQETEVFERNVLRQQPVRSDHYIYIPRLQSQDYRLLFLWAPQAREGFDPHAITVKPVFECQHVLTCEDRRRNEHGNLFTVHHRFERRTYGHFRFAEPDISANEPVHGGR